MNHGGKVGTFLGVVDSGIENPVRRSALLEAKMIKYDDGRRWYFRFPHAWVCVHHPWNMDVG